MAYRDSTPPPHLFLGEEATALRKAELVQSRKLLKEGPGPLTLHLLSCVIIASLWPLNHSSVLAVVVHTC